MGEGNSRAYELTAGLVLPGVFGAELVCFFQMLTHDWVTHYERQLLSWQIKYAFGAWFVLYVCTSFVVTVTHVNKATYSGASCVIATFEAALSFAALAVLGFVDAEVTHNAFQAQPERPLGYAFLAVCLIAVVGAFSSAAPSEKHVRVARWIGAAVGSVAAAMLLTTGSGDHWWASHRVFVAGVALGVCYLALMDYFIGRWFGP